MKGISTLTFVTGNKGKLEELKMILGDKIQLDNEKIDLTEIQGTPQNISIVKGKEAYKLLKKPVLIEDTSLIFNALNGMPGPYIKWFYDSIGNEGLYKLLNGFEDKTAYALCILCIVYSETEDPILIEGKCNGIITAPSIGTKGFGWDNIFQPDGYNETFADLDQDIKNKISHRAIALDKFKKMLLSPTIKRQARGRRKSRKGSRRKGSRKGSKKRKV